jgi:ABC-type bacteriocin/lantibiotic exporter with double-glycine peptidase domain
MKLPLPAIVELRERFIIVGRVAAGDALVQIPSESRPQIIKRAELEQEWTGRVVLMVRRASLPDVARRFDMTWFLQAMHKYRRLLGEVLIASFFLQLFALVTPLFFQVVTDKVLTHRSIAAVFQEPLLLRGTVAHNVGLGLALRGMGRAQREVRIRSVMEQLKIADLAERSVAMLSGGEAQRTSLARALVLDLHVLFLDEPFAALDQPTRRRLVRELAELLRARRVATVFVTHDLAEATILCDRCVILDSGAILQDGAVPTLLSQPRTPRVAEIVGVESFPNTVPGVAKEVS